MYHFVKFRSGYLTVTPPHSSTRYICFKHRKDAGVCKAYVANFKKKYGQWPNMDMNSDYSRIEPMVKEKKDIEHEIEIETLDDDDIGVFTSLSASNILYCHSFGVVPEDSTRFMVTFSGQEIDYEYDVDVHVSSLVQRLNTPDS